MMDNGNEVLDRTRRIETRLTRLIQAMGFDPGSQKPHYNETTQMLNVPSRHVSLQECLLAVPAGQKVQVWLKDDLLGTLVRE